jgi:hypothetical protein
VLNVANGLSQKAKTEEPNSVGQDGFQRGGDFNTQDKVKDNDSGQGVEAGDYSMEKKQILGTVCRVRGAVGRVFYCSWNMGIGRMNN